MRKHPNRSGDLDTDTLGEADAGIAALDLQAAGRKLTERRVRRGLTQSEAATRAGIPRTYLIALEAGRHEPTLRTLAALARALGTDLAWLIWHLVGTRYADPGGAGPYRQSEAQPDVPSCGGAALLSERAGARPRSAGPIGTWRMSR